MGIGVGVLVGNVVGISVGTPVGNAVGISVGTPVGISVGFTVKGIMISPGISSPKSSCAEDVNAIVVARMIETIFMVRLESVLIVTVKWRDQLIYGNKLC